MLDETHVMNACKEDCCYVSLDFRGDMRKAALRLHPDNDVARDYVLPDFTTRRRGFARSAEESTGRPREPGEQIVRMNWERFAVPEILFNPSDIGIQQAGVPEAVLHAVSRCPPEAHRWLYRNIVLTGGCANLPGARERTERDVRALAPEHYEVAVRLPEDPVAHAWEGGAALADDPALLEEMSVSRAEYQESGHQACLDKYYL